MDERALEAYLQRHICGPLGMHDTSFVGRDEWASRSAAVHHRQPDGSVAPADQPAAAPPEFHRGGGGLSSTGPDYIRFLRMLLAEGELDGARILAPETVALMGRNAVGDLAVPILRSRNPDFAQEFDMFPGQVKKWGLSFLMNTEDVPGGRGAGSLAWAGIFNTHFWIDPKRRVAALLLMQLLPFQDAAAMGLLAAFERAVYTGRT